MKTIIEFKNVCKQYVMGEVKIDANKNINFAIEEGELVVILGASGAEKPRCSIFSAAWIRQAAVRYWSREWTSQNITKQN